MVNMLQLLILCWGLELGLYDKCCYTLLAEHSDEVCLLITPGIVVWFCAMTL